MTHSEFTDWKRHPVTQEIFKQLADRMIVYTETLIATAGTSPVDDAKNSGAILAIRDMLTIEYEETQAE